MGTSPTPTGRPSRRQILASATALAVAGAAGGCAGDHSRSGAADGDDSVPTGDYRFERRAAPARTVVRAADGRVLATFTDGARTVLLAGPTRTWSEPRTTDAVVRSDAWVRLMDGVWNQGKERTRWFRGWFPKALADRGPDVFAVAFQYGDGARDRHTASGLRYAGEAHFGPLLPGQSPTSSFSRDEKSDFYDYLGVPWSFPDGIRKHPEKKRYGDVDCSGFMRLVWGYRMGYPMHATNRPGVGLPRRAHAIASRAPGVLLIPNTGRRPDDISPLLPGDLVFFAIESGRPRSIDHVGMYMGPDTDGHPRFYSSRSRANGPTMGDLAGRATLDGHGFYAQGFRTARRL
ncbi:C40 family peptidase [Streptomyces sp. LX-29]|uniref:NlpC/P60 family protein n=1 Tax=Streptomyces sp. LX-29 TaxID=2900152 RepID=UPI00240D95FB|nr:NlpC/P60 family protein [Streptomyces sp. LX-29]WFB10498.1 C40 family peptidase [Streptomyces sp. LX-29]